MNQRRQCRSHVQVLSALPGAQSPVRALCASAFGGEGADWARHAAILKNHLGIRDIQQRVRVPQPRRTNEQASSQSRDGCVMTVGVRAGGHTCSTPQFSTDSLPSSVSIGVGGVGKVEGIVLPGL